MNGSRTALAGLSKNRIEALADGIFAVARTAIPPVSRATAFYSPRLALYLYLTLPLAQIAPSRLDSLAPSATRRRT